MCASMMCSTSKYGTDALASGAGQSRAISALVWNLVRAAPVSVTLASSSFHPSGDDPRLPGDMPRQDIRGQENRCAGNIIGPRDLRERHGRRHFPNDLRIAQFRSVPWHNGPARANAIDASAAIIGGMGSEA